MVRKRPNILESTPSRIRGNARWLQQQLGKPVGQLRGLLFSNPRLLYRKIDGEQWAAWLDSMEAEGIDRFTALAKFSNCVACLTRQPGVRAQQPPAAELGQAVGF